MVRQQQIQKFSDDASPAELLAMGIVLYSIAAKGDITELNRFVIASAKIIESEDFSKLVKRVCKMLGEREVNGVLRSDWLLTSLYELYRSTGC